MHGARASLLTCERDVMAQTIPLTRGYKALVDEQDYSYLRQWSWRVFVNREGNTYAVTTTSRRASGGRRYLAMHTLIAARMGLSSLQVDHRNGNGLDNRRRNLRPATSRQNAWNRGPQSNNVVGLKGVTRITKTGRYRASIRVNGRQRHLGCFATAEEAARAYDKAARFHFGEFARLNAV